eukprot:gnl/MRDRNA2_/MRDRNA2_26709_c0_seq1.p1 gnl/MRDRNA2_/MRDRNA2_26709_c0~~gnl/MRDRNA2_/MRDRNA2_26709_c0_seq1.p1  ORF type:complete len:170 (-),score=35.11 gnl/MRDRNA2_/MRDRNA2_26709_c0_seq1:446-934(-)
MPAGALKVTHAQHGIAAEAIQNSHAVDAIHRSFLINVDGMAMIMGLTVSVLIALIIFVYLYIAKQKDGEKDYLPENREVGISDVTVEVGSPLDLKFQAEAQRRQRTGLPGCVSPSSSESESTEMCLEERMARFDEQCRRLEQQMAINEERDDDLSSNTSVAD